MANAKEFIAKIAEYAAADAKRTGVPASLTIAQAALESNWGRSGLTTRANNLFGIKGTGPAGSVTMPTTEYVGGKAIKVNAAFRAYRDWGESIADHSALLVNGVSWNRKLYAGCIGVDGKTAARAVAKAGYATDPGYAEKLIALIDTYELEKYDEIGTETKGEEPMTKEERAAFEALSAKVFELAVKTTALESKRTMDVPEWAKAAVEAAVKAEIVDTPNGGSEDFYRVLTVMHRKGLI